MVTDSGMPSHASRLDPIIQAYRDHYTNPPLIVDVGARDGDDTTALVDALGGHGVAVEARPDAADQIRAKHPHLTVIHAAAHDHDGTTGFAVLESDDPDVVGSSGFRYERSYALGVPAHVIQVPCRRLDGIIPPGLIGVLKVDVEGYTLEALHGLGDRISDVRVAHLETETPARAGAPWFERVTNQFVADFMYGHGFRLTDLAYEWGPSIEDQTWVRLP